MSKITYEVVEHGGGRYLPGPSDTPFAYKKPTQPKQAELARKYDNHIPEIPARKQLGNQECERLGSEARDRLGCARELGCGFLATHREIQRNVFSQIPTFRIECLRLVGVSSG